MEKTIVSLTAYLARINEVHNVIKIIFIQPILIKIYNYSKFFTSNTIPKREIQNKAADKIFYG